MPDQQQTVSTKILGVSRAPQFSPNSVKRDAEILQGVGHELANRYGFGIRLIDERFLIPDDLEGIDCAFSMGRAKETLTMLAEAESQGLYMPNSAKSLLLLRRKSIRVLCLSAGIATPPGHDETNIPDDLTSLHYPCWLKRDDNWTQGADDVQFISDATSMRAALDGFSARGITHFVTERHLEGDVLKFYGVAGTGFFYCCHPSSTPQPFSKFGCEALNGVTQGYGFDSAQLQRWAETIAGQTGVAVYGGDAIVCPSGEVSIIDFNDWPSFSACREAAATAIAQLIAKHIQPTIPTL